MLQEPMTQPTAKTTQSIAVLEHLSGPLLGTRTVLSGASIAIHVDNDRRLRAVEPGDVGDAAADPVATLTRGERTYHLQADPDKRETAEKVLGFHADFCPVARTMKGCVDISTELQFE